jgi:hypothetical protein
MYALTQNRIDARISRSVAGFCPRDSSIMGGQPERADGLAHFSIVFKVPGRADFLLYGSKSNRDIECSPVHVDLGYADIGLRGFPSLRHR